MTSQKGFVHVFLLIILTIVGIGGIGYFAYKNGQIKIDRGGLSIISTLPSSTNQLSDGKIYTNTDVGYTVNYPATWRLENNCDGGSTSDNYTCLQSPDLEKSPAGFVTKGEQVTLDTPGGSMYVGGGGLSEFCKQDAMFKHISCEQTTINSLKAVKKVFDNFNVIDVAILDSKNNIKLTIRLEFTSPNPYTKYTFDQILSTFKFIDANPTKTVDPTSKPVNKKVLTYSVSGGWNTTKDKTNTFEISYNPVTQESSFSEQNDLNITYKNLNNNTYYSPYSSSIIFGVRDYNNGSRHEFIYKLLGENPRSTGSTTANYKEYEYEIGDKSCLILDGISISQYYKMWGMCAISTTQAIYFGTFRDLSEIEANLKTLKFYK